MKRLLIALAALSIPTLAAARPRIVTLRPGTFKANPNFKPIFTRADEGNAPVSQLGEVVILEGDSRLVSRDDEGNFGLSLNGSVQNPPEITARFYSKYADEFDEVIVFTTFDDAASQGAAAYLMPVSNPVSGIGFPVFDDSESWGSNGKLLGFVNMMNWEGWDAVGVPITDPRNPVYSTLGQEFAHAWLSFMRYNDSTGNASEAMLGRDQAHWASTLQADGSMMDGNRLTPQPDGSYLVSDFMSQYSSLDLYGMGLIAAAEVRPFYLIKGATTSNGTMVDPADWLREGTKLFGTREEITIDQVIAAEGEREPTYEAANKSFRIAFVLVTKPGEKASDVVPAAQAIDQLRVVWEREFSTYTSGRGTMCTQVSGPCNMTTTARVLGGKVVEDGGNKNGIIEPGEKVLVSFNVVNDSPLPALGVQVKATGAVFPTAAESVIPELAVSMEQEVVFPGELPADAVCGESVTIEVASTVDGHTYRGFAQVTPGLTTAINETFEGGMAGFIANPDQKDSTRKNSWEFGTPEYYGTRFGFLFQPPNCRSGTKCWFTGLKPGMRGTTISSLGVGEAHLWSRPIDLSVTYKPKLRYFAWYMALDTTVRRPTVVEKLDMVLEGTTDDGQTWIELDRITGADPTWRQRDVDLEEKGVPREGTLLLRWTVHNPVATHMVEAGIDDVKVITLTQQCNPDYVPAKPPVFESSGGCNVGGDARSSLGMLLFATALLLARRARLRRS